MMRRCTICACMRLITTLACVLLATPSLAWDRGCTPGLMPPPEMIGVIPTVPYHVIYINAENIQDLCWMTWAPLKKVARGCTVQEMPGEYWIYIENGSHGAAEQLCTLWHEKAHLPPLSWDHGERGLYKDSEGRWRPRPLGPRYHSWRKGVANLIYGPPTQ